MQRFAPRVLALFATAFAALLLSWSAQACSLVQVGSASLDPEKETIGRSCAAADVETTGAVAAPHNLYSLPPQAFGAASGDPEKDTIAYAPLADD